MSKIGFLSPRDLYAARALAGTDPLLNLFLHAALEEGDIESCMLGMWNAGKIQNLVFTYNAHALHLSDADQNHVLEMADYLARWHVRPRHMIGPRAVMDLTLARTMWQFDHLHPHVLMKCSRLVPGEEVQCRRAAQSDVKRVRANAIAANIEDLKIDPTKWDDVTFSSHLSEAVHEGRVYVLEERGEIIFQMVKSYSMPWACHVGGVWVYPSARGRGLAERAMRAVCQGLLKQHNTITLEVREDNIPAMRTYEKLGFRYHAPLRMALSST